MLCGLEGGGLPGLGGFGLGFVLLPFGPEGDGLGLGGFGLDFASWPFGPEGDGLRVLR